MEERGTSRYAAWKSDPSQAEPLTVERMQECIERFMEEE